MKLRSFGFLVLLAVAGTIVLAQDSSSDLPSAPSAVKQGQTQPPPPQSAPASTPEKTETPASAPASTEKNNPPARSNAPGGIVDLPPVNQSADDSPTTVIKIGTNEVNVVFTASDRHGRLVTDLTRDDFRVLNDGRPDVQVRHFERETNLPLHIGLLVDASNSIRDRFKFEQESAIEFLSRTVRRSKDSAFVVGFDATPEVTQDFTDDNEALSKGVRMLRPGGGTAMFDAIYFACRDKIAKAPREGAVRNAIVLLSDGDDNQSHVTREEAVEMAERAEVIIYSISTNITGSKNEGDKILRYISEATGGRAFFPFQLTEVANAFDEIQEELRSQYALTYRVPGFIADGRFHTIQILAQNRKNVKIRSRRGYYATAR